MATVNLRSGGTSAGDGDKLAGGTSGQLKKFTKIIDFAATNRDAADVLQLFDVPAGSFIHRIHAQVITAEGATATAIIGDDDDDNGFMTALNLNSAAHSCSSPGVLTEGAPNTRVPAYGAGRFCAAAKVVSMVLGHDMDLAKVKITMMVSQ